jgi:hypothetical protein
MMRRFLAVGTLLMMAAVVAVLLTQYRVWAGDEKDVVQPNTLWKGEILQDGQVFPATISINARDNDRIKGEVHFKFGGELCQLTFQGNVVGGRTVVWITDKKEGNVTFPGLYIGKVEGKTISGTWQVPGANQYDRFSVKLSE